MHPVIDRAGADTGEKLQSLAFGAFGSVQAVEPARFISENRQFTRPTPGLCKVLTSGNFLHQGSLDGRIGRMREYPEKPLSGKS